MSSFVRRFAIASTVLALFLVCSAVPMYRQYTWLGKALVTAKSNGWVLIATSENYIDPAQPWTFFKQPVNMAVFTRPFEIRRMGDTLLFAPTLWMRNHSLVDGKDVLDWRAADCRNRKLAYVDETVKDLDALRWITHERGDLGDKLVTYMCTLRK